MDKKNLYLKKPENISVKPLATLYIKITQLNEFIMNIFDFNLIKKSVEF